MDWENKKYGWCMQMVYFRSEPQWMEGDVKDGWCVWIISSNDEQVVGGR